MPHFIAKFSDLGPSATNPSGRWDYSFLVLKQAIDRGLEPDKVAERLFQYLSSKGVSGSQISQLYALPKDTALEDLLKLIDAKLPRSIPEKERAIVASALAYQANQFADTEDVRLDSERQRVADIRQRFQRESRPPVRPTPDLLRYPNHPLANTRRVCPKCKGINVSAPAYPGDYFDCMDCGHSVAPTKNQVQAMAKHKPYREAAERTVADLLEN